MAQVSWVTVCSVSLGLGTMVGAGLEPRLSSHGSLFYVTGYAAGLQALVASVDGHVHAHATSVRRTAPHRPARPARRTSS